MEKKKKQKKQLVQESNPGLLHLKLCTLPLDYRRLVEHALKRHLVRYGFN